MHVSVVMTVRVPEALDRGGPLREGLDFVKCEHDSVWVALRLFTGMLPSPDEPLGVRLLGQRQSLFGHRQV